MSHDYLYFLMLLAARTAVVLIILVIGLRLLGKRQLGQMNIYDLALVMALANCIQNAMTHGNGNVSAGLVTSGTLMCIGWLFAKLFVKLPKLEDRVVGSPTLLLNDGHIMEERLRREHVTMSELMAAIRAHGLSAPNEVLMAVLEVDGAISIVPRTAAHHRTKKRVRDRHGNLG